MIPTSGLQELTSLLTRPCLALAFADRSQDDLRRHVLADQLFAHSVRQGRPQARPDVGHGARRGNVLAAHATRTAPLTFLGPPCVFALRAALADVGDLVHPLLYVPDLKPVKPPVSQSRSDVEPHEQFVVTKVSGSRFGLITS